MEGRAGPGRTGTRLTGEAGQEAEVGFADSSERWIAWTSVLQAFEALISIAERWTYWSSVWDAFRALGILNGMWPFVARRA
jgi:hypothetical protein